MKTAMMRLFVFLSLIPLGAGAASLGEIKSVYLLPMSRGFDQYLANQLTASGVFTVTTDPKAADAIFTDRLGQGFEQRLQELYPPPEPAEKPDEEPAEKEDKKARAAGDFPAAPPVGGMATFGRGKGTLFLVDTRSRQVLWSTYEEPRSSEARDLNRSAGNIVKRIRTTLSGKKP
jgi:hypothetical protein